MKIIIKYLSAILLALFVLLNIQSCSSCEEIDPHFYIHNMFIVNKEVAANGNVIDLIERDSSSFENFFIRCFLEHSYESDYASCEEVGERIGKHGLDTLFVITNMDYDSTYKAGDTLSPIVLIAAGWDYVPLKEFVKDNKAPFKHRNGFRIKFSKKPIIDKKAIAFTVVMKLDDGKTIIKNSPRVIFK